MLFDLIGFFPFLAGTVVLMLFWQWFTELTQLLQNTSAFGVTAAKHKLLTSPVS